MVHQLLYSTCSAYFSMDQLPLRHYYMELQAVSAFLMSAS